MKPQIWIRLFCNTIGFGTNILSEDIQDCQCKIFTIIIQHFEVVWATKHKPAVACRRTRMLSLFSLIYFPRLGSGSLKSSSCTAGWPVCPVPCSVTWVLPGWCVGIGHTPPLSPCRLTLLGSPITRNFDNEIADSIHLDIVDLQVGFVWTYSYIPDDRNRDRGVFKGLSQPCGFKVGFSMGRNFQPINLVSNCFTS